MRDDRYTSTVEDAAEYECRRARDEDHEYFDRGEPSARRCRLCGYLLPDCDCEPEDEGSDGGEG